MIPLKRRKKPWACFNIKSLSRYRYSHYKDKMVSLKKKQLCLLQYKDSLSWYRYSHYKDKMVVIPSYLYNKNPYTGKMASFYWNGPQQGIWCFLWMHQRKIHAFKWYLTIFFTWTFLLPEQQKFQAVHNYLSWVRSFDIYCSSNFWNWIWW